MTAFNLGAMLSAPTVQTENQVKDIPCEMCVPYHNHIFALYEDERLDDMVESVKTNGVLTPIIVQPVNGEKYEILIGHNRWNASRIAGISTVPAIVKQGLTAEEAEIYVVESNVMQRGFGNLKLSEQAAAVALRHEKMFSQGKRNDIIRELKMIDNPQIYKQLTDVHDEEFKKSRDKIGGEYGLSGKTVSRLLRIDKLIGMLKDFVDSGEIAFLAGVQLSYLTVETQETVALLTDQYRIDVKKAEQLRAAADDGFLDDDSVEKILSGALDEPKIPKPKSVKIRREVFSKYFNKDTSQEEISDIIERALAAYFNE